MTQETLYTDAVGLLKQLIATPSFSSEEDATAEILFRFLQQKDVTPYRFKNNIWALNKHFNKSLPSILLNSHHDTVKPNVQYTRNPFDAAIEDGKLYGLGSNDAGGCVVSLMAAFLHFYQRPGLKFNVILAITAEEETSGTNGIEALLKHPEFRNNMEGHPGLFDFAIVGEPTKTNLAIAEKGLLVLDCVAEGRAGHAARDEGENAIYKALNDIQWFKTFSFPKVSESLGEIKMSVTSVTTENKAHNVVPAECRFVVDIRVTDQYTHEEIMETVKQHTSSQCIPRSFRMRSSKIDPSHPVVKAGISLGKTTYGSPTTSDAAMIDAPVLKCGPGDSARSHMADEFIFLKDIEDGIDTYIRMLEIIQL